MIVKEKPETEADEKIRRLWNYQISQVYVICALNCIMGPTRPEKYRWDIVRMDRELKIPSSETLNEIYLGMPKFVLPLSQCDTLYKRWLYVLNNIEIMERLPKELNNQIFRKLKSIVEVERDPSAALDTSLEDGVEKGKANEQRLIAGNFKKQGVNNETIAQCTGLSMKKINDL